MLNINKADVKQMVYIMEYILDKEDKVSVNQLLKDNKLTFEEYRLMSSLTMPAIRRKNENAHIKAKGSYYKGMYLKEKNARERLEDALRMAYDYLDRYFKEETKDESDMYLLAGGDGEDAVSASGTGDDGGDGTADETTISETTA